MTQTGAGWKATARSTWEKWTAGLSFNATFVIVFSTIILILFHENGNTGFFRVHFARYFGPSTYGSLYPGFYWYGCSFIMLGVIPLLVGRYALKVPFRDWGVGLGDWKFGLTAAIGMYLLFLPILYYFSSTPAFIAKYPLFAGARKTMGHFALHEIAYATYFIGWEFIYRGFMLFGLKPKLGYYAVFIQMVPFAIMHFGKPQIETLAAVFAGIILGYLALRTRSFWYGWLLHALVAFTNDALAIWRDGGIN